MLFCNTACRPARPRRRARPRGRFRFVAGREELYHIIHIILLYYYMILYMI